MLGHLIKYDLKFIYKQLIIFYAIALGCAIIARFTNLDNPPFLITFLHEFTQGAALGFSFGVLVNCTMRTWARFRNNTYGDESYLTHTLPISRATLWTSKFLSSVIVILISFIAILITFLISPISNDLFNNWNTYNNFGNGELWILIFSLIGCVMLQTIFLIQAGFMGTILGYRHNSGHIVRAVLYGLIIYLVGGSLILLLVFLYGQFDSVMFHAAFEGQFENPSTLYNLFNLISGLYILLITATYFINRKLLTRGVDVD